MNKLQNPKQSISLYAHPDQKLNMIALVPLLGNENATLARIPNSTVFTKDLLQADDHGSLPLDAQRGGRCVGVDSFNVVARRGRGSSRSHYERIVSSLSISTATTVVPPRSPHVQEKESPCADVLAPRARLEESGGQEEGRWLGFGARQG